MMTTGPTKTTKDPASEWRNLGLDRSEVRLCGGRLACLSLEERNRWHEFIFDVPEYLELHVAEIRVEQAARAGTGEESAAAEHHRCTLAIHTYSTVWLEDLERTRELAKTKAAEATAVLLTEID